MDMQMQALVGIYEALKRWARANRCSNKEAVICLETMRQIDEDCLTEAARATSNEAGGGADDE